VSSLGQYLTYYALSTPIMMEGDLPYILPSRFCVEFVDLASIADQHRDEIGNKESYTMFKNKC
jgi:hypothetical protein